MSIWTTSASAGPSVVPPGQSLSQTRCSRRRDCVAIGTSHAARVHLSPRLGRVAGPHHVLTRSALIACAALAPLVSACGNSAPERVTCIVKLGSEQTSVSLDAKVGDSVTATISSYSIAFTFLAGLQLEAEVKDPHSTLIRIKARGTTAEGLAGTPDGQLGYSCAPS